MPNRVLRLHVVACAEPEIYHGGLPRVTVFVGPEFIAEWTDEEERGTEVAWAKSAWRTVLPRLADLTFAYSSAALAPDGAVTGVAVGARLATIVTPPGAPAAADAVFGWLARGETAALDRASYWVTRSGASDSLEITADEVGATHLVRGAAGWSAPVAHAHGLVRILDLPAQIAPTPPAPTEATLVLPVSGGDDPVFDPPFPRPALGVGRERRWLLAYPIAFAGLDDDVRTEVVVHALTARDAAPLSGLLSANGLLMVGDTTDAARRRLEEFERHAAELLSGDAPLQALGCFLEAAGFTPSAEGKASGKDDPPAFSALAGWLDEEARRTLARNDNFFAKWVRRDGETPSWMLSSPWTSWAAMSRLASVLDPIVLALRRPSGGDASEGPILSIWTSILLEVLGAPDAGLAWKLSAAARQGAILRILRDRLQKHPLLSDRNPPPETLFEELWKLHAIEGSPDAKLLRPILGNAVVGSDVIADLAVVPPTKTEQEDGSAEWRLPRGLKTSAIFAAIDRRVEAVRGEKGTEAVLKTIFEAVLGDADLAAALEGHFTSTDPGKQAKDVLLAKVAEARRRFHAVLDGPFNGAEAVRRGAGADYCEALLRANGAEGDIVAGLEATNFLARRFAVDATPPSDPLEPVRSALIGLDTLLETLPAAAAETDKALIRPILAAAMARVVGRIAAIEKTEALFRPDPAPAPLSLRIGTDFGGTALAEFAHDHNGVAIAIRRIDHPAPQNPDPQNSDRWAHANLAAFETTDATAETDPTWRATAAIDPILPALVDGRGPMFLSYEGFPFSSTAFARTASDRGAFGAARRPAFYDHDVADAGEFGSKPTKFVPLPALAYGRAFEVFGFATSKGGCLPAGLAARETPWLPNPSMTPPEPIATAVTCSRRTTVSSVKIEETDAIERRIGATIEGVLPLAADHPRLSIMASNGTGGRSNGTIDLWRDAAGGGRLGVPEHPGTLAYRLDDVAWAFSGTGAGWLCVMRFFTKNTETSEFGHDSKDDEIKGETDDELPVRLEPQTFGAGRSIVISLTRETATDVSLRVMVGTKELAKKAVPGSATSLWLSLDLSAVPPGPGIAPPTGVSVLSFADPDDGSVGRTDGLLLLPSGKSTWREDVPRTRAVTIRTPRVGFLDFDRWFANADLAARAFGAPGSKAVKRLFEIIFFAYAHAHLAPELQAHLNALPDPAVEALHLELVPLDRLGAGGLPPAPAPLAIDLKRGFENLIAALTTEGDRPDEMTTSARSLFRQAGNSHVELSLSSRDDRSAFDAVFKLMARQFDREFTIGTVAADAALSLSDEKATVPAGVVADLLVHPVVAAAHFARQGHHPPVFFERFDEIVPKRVGATGDFAFPPVSVRVEAMRADLLDGVDASRAASRLLTCLAPPNVRDHRLMVTPTALFGGTPAESEADWNLWRSFGRIEIESQRWRPTGRPIDHHPAPWNAVKPTQIAPYPGAVAGEVRRIGVVCVPLEPEPVAEFERRAFFERDDDTVTRSIKLSPLPPSSRIQAEATAQRPGYGQFELATFPWERPSATYFRHRYRLWSRYEGALARATAHDFPLSSQRNRAWAMRVAVLADVSTGELTRPQLRSLLPLTTTPGGSRADTMAPPVMAILQEPPSSFGGLAERVTAEAKTGLGWALGAAKDASLAVVDLRKEFGPDPRLSLKAFDATEASRLTLATEGPMGLTFDRAGTRSASFANSVHILTPRVSGGDATDFQEHFIGAILRRHFDPAWLVVRPPAATPGAYDPTTTWWATWPLAEIAANPAVGAPAKALVVRRPRGTGPDGEGESFVLGVKVDGDAAEFVVDPRLLDGLALAREPIRLASCGHNPATTVAVLQRQSAPGIHSTTVFLVPAEEEGGETVPIGSFEWSSPDAFDLHFPGCSSVSPTVSSAATLIAWARTQRDFERWVDKGGGADATWVTLGDDVVAGVADGRLALRREVAEAPPRDLWLVGSSTTYGETQKAPMGIHRHLALLFTRRSRGVGRPFEEFVACPLYDRARIDLAPLNGEAFEHVRLLEFEMPAMPLTSHDVDTVPAIYRSALFDPGSKLPQGKANDARRLRFLVRLAGSPVHTAQFRRLTFTLDRPGTTVDAEKRLGRWDLTFADAVSGLILEIAGTEFTATGIGPDGGEVTVTTTPIDPPPATVPDIPAAGFDGGVLVSLRASGGPQPAEFWCDVSMLVGRRAGPALFDFDWLFGEAEEVPSPEVAVRAEALRLRPEAQARLIAVSPPIAVRP